MNGGEVAASVRAELEPRRAEMVELLGRLVEIEVAAATISSGLNRFAAELYVAVRRTLGAWRTPCRKARTGRATGTQFTVDCRRRRTLPRVRRLCCSSNHYDTVWPTGTLARIPFSVDPDGVARGPGCFDMKGGIVELYFALQALRARGLRPRRRLEILFTCDEEVGSPGSRPLIERVAHDAALAYVLESPLPGGTLKTARKGTGDYLDWITRPRGARRRRTPEGHQRHAGELAHQIRNRCTRSTTSPSGPRLKTSASCAAAHVPTWWRPKLRPTSTCGSRRWPRPSASTCAMQGLNPVAPVRGAGHRRRSEPPADAAFASHGRPV